MSMARIYVAISSELEAELGKAKQEKGYLRIQDIIRDILGEWFSNRKKEK